MVKIFGANVYTEHVQSALNHEKLQSYLTGRYKLESTYDKNNDPQMVCHIELNLDINDSEELKKLIQTIFVDEIKKINSEYNYVFNEIGEKVKPKIILYNNGHPTYFEKGRIKKTA